MGALNEGRDCRPPTPQPNSVMVKLRLSFEPLGDGRTRGRRRYAPPVPSRPAGGTEP